MKITQATKSRPTLLSGLGFILVSGMLIYAVIILAGEISVEERIVTARFLGFIIAGFFAFITKFGKFIILGIVAIGVAALKFFKRKKPQEGVA